MVAQEVYFYGVNGQKLGTYSVSVSGSQLVVTTTQTAVFFGGKRVAVNGAAFVPDRLGSNTAGKYYPYGEDRGTPIANDQVKYATYTRDSATGLDYADQRYYSNQFGRFMTADRYTASDGPSNPGSWNRYAYVQGDPINANDPRGMYLVWIGDDPGFIDWGDGGGGGGGGVGGCLIDSFDPVPNPFCDSGPVLPPPSDPKPPPMPTCSISLYGRPTPTDNSPADHTYIDAMTIFANGVTTQEIIDAGPILGLSLTGVVLNGWVTPGSIGFYAADNPALSTNHQIGSAYTGADACQDIQKISAETIQYDKGTLVTYNPVPTLYLGGWNSNSFAFTLLNSIGIAFSFGDLPRWTPGWGYQVPGLRSSLP
jgi:RHS repeat-associated protein